MARLIETGNAEELLSDDPNVDSIGVWLGNARVTCPYCWEKIVVEVDKSCVPCQYVEDCQVCCQPILFDVEYDFSGEVQVSTHREND